MTGATVARSMFAAGEETLLPKLITGAKEAKLISAKGEKTDLPDEMTGV